MLSGFKVASPLKIRDFALLWTAMTGSMLGDGIYYVTVAWQVYDLKNSPAALSLVGFAQTLPLVAFVLVGGVLSDRLDRRAVMIAGDVIRALTVAAIGVLALASALELWHVVLLVAVYGVGQALFWPALGAIVPDIVPGHLLVEANSVSQFMRPLTQILLGPAVGGVVVSSFGTGEAFIVSASAFVFSAVVLLLLQPRRVERAAETTQSVLGDIREGFGFVRSQPWLWGTLAMAAVVLLIFWGPFEVLIPFIVKNELGGDAGDLGLVFAAGGFGAIVAALTIGQVGLPRRHITFMYSAWALGALLMVVYAVAEKTWQAAAATFLMQTFFTAAIIVWVTLMQRLVPTALLGRVKSFDWLVSTSLVPLSFVLTGLVAAGIGANATMLGAGVIGAALTMAFLLIPGLRDPEREGSPTYVVLTGKPS